MPSVHIYYFIVKPTLLKRQQGTTGETTTTSPGSPDAESNRLTFKASFESRLLTLFRGCCANVPNITNPSANVNVQVHEIPVHPTRPGIPDFDRVGRAIERQDPIVYIVNPIANADASDARNRRASDELYDTITSGYAEFSGLERPEPNVAEGGLATEISSNTSPENPAEDPVPISAPLVAEVYFNAFNNHDDDAFYRNQGILLANIAFHEIAHLKAECANRPYRRNNPWSQRAITCSIHDYPPPSEDDAEEETTETEPESGETAESETTEPSPDLRIIRDTITLNSQLTSIDRELMGANMLCPIPFYKMYQDVSAQCFSGGSPLAPSPVQEQPEPSPGEERNELDNFDADSLDALDGDDEFGSDDVDTN